MDLAIKMVFALFYGVAISYMVATIYDGIRLRLEIKKVGKELEKAFDKMESMNFGNDSTVIEYLMTQQRKIDGSKTLKMRTLLN